MPRRSERGPFSRYLAGSQVCQRCGGSTTWSSTLTIFGSSACMDSPFLTVRQMDLTAHPSGPGVTWASPLGSTTQLREHLRRFGDDPINQVTARRQVINHTDN